MLNKIIICIIFLYFILLCEGELNHEFSFELLPKRTQCFGEFFPQGTNASITVRINLETYEFFFGIYKFDQMHSNISFINEQQFPEAIQEKQVYYNSKKHEKDQFNEVFLSEIKKSSDYLFCIRNVMPYPITYYLEIMRIPVQSSFQKNIIIGSKKRHRYKNEEIIINQIVNLEENIIYDLNEIEKVKLSQKELEVQNLDFWVITLGIATILGFFLISCLEMVAYKSILRNKKLI